jgi:hypothetical protein
LSAGIKANNDGSAAIQVGGTDYLQIASTGPVTIPGNLIVTGTATVGGIPVGGNYDLVAYTSPATWDATAAKAAGLKAIKITVVGAGGSGGPGVGFPSRSAGGGGGGGGAAVEYVPAANITPGTKTVTAGAGTNSFGPWGTATPNSPTATASATAGSAGGSAAGGAGGAGSGGSLNITGQSGGWGYVAANSAFVQRGATGGGSIFGGGAVGAASGPTGGTGSAGGAYGGGGGGGGGTFDPTPAASSGGAGAPGVVIIEEFY